MWIDLSIIFAFICYAIGVGFVMRKKASRGLTDYFLAGRNLKGWQAGFSMAATQYAADTPLLVAGLVASSGLFSLWRLWIYAVAFLMIGFLFGAGWRRANVLTDAEFTEKRYAGTGAALLRSLKAVHLGTVINCIILAMVLIAATRIAEQFLPWHEWLPASWTGLISNLLKSLNWKMTTVSDQNSLVWVYSADNCISIGTIVLFTWLYSTTGGLRSVVATDIVQLAIAMIATALYAYIVIDQIGGLSEVGAQIDRLYNPETRNALLSFGPKDLSEGTILFLGVVALQWFAQVNADGTGYIAQRIMACRSDHDAKMATVYFTFTQVVIRSLLWMPIVIGLLVLYPSLESPVTDQVSESFRIYREGTFSQGIRDYLPVGVRGLMLTGLIAALASTIDTHLNWGASYWANDLYDRFLMKMIFRRAPQQKELIWVARASNLGVLLLALWVMRYLTSIQTAWHMSLLFGSGLGSVLVLRWIWYRINIWSEFTAGAISLTLAPVLVICYPELSEGVRLVIMAVSSTFFVVTITLLTPPEPIETLKEFYKQVQPPGFWRPIALAAKEDPDLPMIRFRRSVFAIILATCSVFGLLVGFGEIFIGYLTNTSVFFPYILIMIALGLIPIWKKIS